MSATIKPTASQYTVEDAWCSIGCWGQAMSATIKPTASQYTVEDGLNELLTICRDADADPGVVSFILDQQGGANYMYVTLDGLRALVAAAEQLQEAA